jgi:hypothetical protein
MKLHFLLVLCIGFAGTTYAQAWMHIRDDSRDHWQVATFEDGTDMVVNVTGLVTTRDGTAFAAGFTSQEGGRKYTGTADWYEYYLQLYRSDDSGKSWERLSTPEVSQYFKYTDRSGSQNTNALSPADLVYRDGTLRLVGKVKTFESTDQGESWTSKRTEPDKKEKRPVLWTPPPKRFYTDRGGRYYTIENWRLLLWEADETTYSEVEVEEVLRFKHIIDICPNGAVLVSADMKSDRFIPQNHLISVTPSGEIIQDFGRDFPGTLRFFHFLSDGHLLAGGVLGVYTSVVSACRADGGIAPNPPPVPKDPCAGWTPPDLHPTKKLVFSSSNGEDIVNTGVWLEEGDYACVLIQGSFDDSSVEEFKIYQSANPYGVRPFGLYAHVCPQFLLLDEAYLRTQFSRWRGNYFVTSVPGEIQVAIRQKDISVPTSKFKITIYTLTKQQHQNRNCFNQCPRIKPVRPDGQDLWVDSSQRLWTDGREALTQFGDWLVEECWHEGGIDYRSRSTSTLGSQCVYDRSSEALINSSSNLALGTYDYGYQDGQDNYVLHHILDVFAHVAYLDWDEEIKYLSTPAGNID